MHRRAFVATLALGAAAPARALYEPAPVEEVALLRGTWSGTLTYDDWSKPGRLVTLPLRLVAAPVALDEVALHHVHDEGNGKAVQSYERLAFRSDPPALGWRTGLADAEARYALVAREREAGGLRLVAERPDRGGTERLVLQLGPAAWRLAKEERAADGRVVVRSVHALARAA